ncbi:Transcriptional adapter 2-alpha [Labeo rohita]|uniref:Transcriptional adapter 2-alpha n=1 Tax=Labeo rohita TaxID=84645 RepID=A0ABQ8LZX6_LABRO|nr:Transcriptional adapter 2-alpha [Labeo rohita]
MDRLASFGNDPFDKPPCRGCSSYLVEPYIKCAECGPSPFLLCLQCFTRGYEYKKHQSDHKYEIMTSDFPVLEPGWTAQEEMALLEAVMDCGFATDDPPRPSFDSQLSRDMAGYMPARADFMEEFDNYAEWDLKDIDFVDDDSDILHSLKVAVVDIYHSRLKERQRRKKIIRDHGLLNLRKFQTALLVSLPLSRQKRGDSYRGTAALLSWRLRESWCSSKQCCVQDISDSSNGLCASAVLSVLERRYPKEVQDLYDVMRRFARVVGPIEHDKFIESHACAKVYERVKRMREDERRKRNMLCDVLHDAGITPVVTTITTSGRRSAPPLNLTGLPGTEKLNEREKELCQVVRLVPGAYLEYKQALLNECRRQGGLRLAQARSLIKIDVNKTRKIYDFLIKEGYINKA